MRVAFISVLFFVLFQNLAAQPSQSGRISAETYALEFLPTASESYDLSGYGHFTSVVIKINFNDHFTQSTITISNSLYPVIEDEHSLAENHRVSLPVIVDRAASTAELFLPGLENPFTVYLIFAPSINRPLGVLRKTVIENCEIPLTVPQSEWRSGLSAPVYTRSFTETENIIVHHSATSNSLTDYMNVVRNIYLYHTQVNGWSDIGYNYLVAPDGTIFNGRDPDAGDQDLVLGAHFCGSNSTTMGICVLGTFTSEVPGGDAISSLLQLIAWKAHKDSLDVSGVSSHPLNGNLPVIAGHRQGCSTLCPGEMLFQKLPEIRMEVEGLLEACNNPLFASSINVYPNPTNDDILIKLPEDKILEEIALISIGGQRMSIAVEHEGQNGFKANIAQLRPGVYLLSIKLSDSFPEVKKIIVQ